MSVLLRLGSLGDTAIPAMTRPLDDPRNLVDDFDVVQCIAQFDAQLSRLSFDEVTKSALQFMAEELKVARASIALLREEGDGFLLFDATVDVKGVESGKILGHGSASLSETVADGVAIYRPDIREWPKSNPVDAAFATHGLLSTFSVPLVAEGRCIGTLNAAAVGVDGISPALRQVIASLAPRLASAIETGRVHDSLRESRKQLSDVFETVGDGIAVVEYATRRVVMANSTMARMVGRTLDEMKAFPIDQLHPPGTYSDVVSRIRAMMSEGAGTAADIPMMRQDGGEFLADVTARRTMIGERSCVVAVFRDASARRLREEAQIQTQKLESIRTLAAGIAHDFNNLLTGVVGNVSLAQMLFDETHEAWSLLEEAQRAATRATALTRQLLTFAKGGTPLRERLNLVKVLRDATTLATAGTQTQCHFELSHDSVTVQGDEGQLAQVFQNLVRNAVEAMPNGGTVKVRLNVQKGSEGQEACVEVCDEGTGVAPELLDKIFVPFFSTKSGGSGMGLAVAHSIVHSHGGRMLASSEPGIGTTFRVFLAVCDGPVTKPELPSMVARGAGRVLVMDDEAIVRQVSTHALSLAGYHTEATNSGRDAVDAYQRALAEDRRFDAVVLDLTVPGGMGGRDAAAEILRLDPSARLMVSSGYSEDSAMAEFRRYGFSAVLPKPYSARQLCDAVQRLLRPNAADDSTA